MLASVLGLIFLRNFSRSTSSFTEADSLSTKDFTWCASNAVTMVIPRIFALPLLRLMVWMERRYKSNFHRGSLNKGTTGGVRRFRTLDACQIQSEAHYHYWWKT
ncbi:hypothetical protein LINPERHAP2_LOCUS16800 [Linum perenne]